MELMHLGYGEESLLQYQENGFVTTELFDYWCEKILFPDIDKIRTKLGYFESKANFLKLNHAVTERAGQIPGPIAQDLFKLCR
jgi:hypothetical protein